MLIAFNKPYGVVSQFTGDGTKRTLADYIDLPGFYAAGRLDADSEGLLLLTDDGALQNAIADPSQRIAKRYLAQVEGVPTRAALERFREGLCIGTGAGRYRARAASAVAIADPAVPERTPPVRVRAAIPTAWIEVVVSEGKNRQVRRMTAAIGFPTLRLFRVGVGPLDLFALAIAPGMWTAVDADRLALSPVNARPGGPPRKSGGALSTGFRNRR